MNTQVYEFLKKHQMNSDAWSMQDASDRFIEHMKSGLAGDIRSMMMIPAYVGLHETVKRNEKVIVLDAGGTNLRSALVHFDDRGKAVIEQFSKQPMLGTQGELTREQFIEGFADLIAPFDEQSDRVGFCFSFATEILPNGDGKVVLINKEVKVKDMTGVVLGESINKALTARGLHAKKFMIINDTVAAMLGGAATFPDRSFDSYIGFILGTGTNTCYLENNRNITKAGPLPEGSMAVNMESGAFNQFPRSDIDIAFDATTDNVGVQVYEKMVSGAYQGHVILATLKTAATEGLFTDATAAAVQSIPSITMYDVDCFSAQPDGDNPIASLAKCEEDRAKIYDIIDDNFERVAKMVCVNLSSIILATGKGKDPKKPVCISAEGTTFYKSVLFRPKLDRYMNEFLVQKHHAYYEFVKADDATLIGSAVAGLF